MSGEVGSNPFLKRLMKEEAGAVVHSSAYAKAQNGGGMGVASAESFSQRQKIDQQRTFVKGYRDSEVMRGGIRRTGGGNFSRESGAVFSGPDGAIGGDLRGVDGGVNGRGQGIIGAREGGSQGIRGRGMRPQQQIASPRQQMTKAPVRRNPGISR